MRKIAREIWEKTTIVKNKDTKAIISFISSRASAKKMIAASEEKKPALAGIVRELEERFADCEGFPLNHDAKDKNAPNRRNIGWIVRYVMASYGYVPISNSDRTRIGVDSGSKYFSSAAVYVKDNNILVPDNSIIVHSTIIDRGITREELWESEESEDYSSIRESIREIVWKKELLGFNDSFIANYLNSAGYKEMLSEKDIQDIFYGVRIPCVELYESIVDMFSFFEKFIVKNKRQYHEILGTSTDRALEAFYKCNINPDEVTDVYVYFSSWDSILDGRYNLLSDGNDDSDIPIDLDSPRFIIKTIDKEYWFHGLTCGYAGQGCGGSQDILLKLGIIEEDEYYVKYEIQAYRCLHYFKENGKWTYVGEESRYDKYYDGIRENSQIDLFSYNDNLTISQSYRYPFRYSRLSEVVEPEYEWFVASMYFINDPVELELIKVDEPEKKILGAINTNPSYQVIVRDRSGRELWLDYPFNDIPDEKRTNLYRFISELGFNVPREFEKNRLIKISNDIYKTYYRS